jgi:chromate transport protein ChrA
MKQRWIHRGLKIALIGIIAVGVFGFIVMSLWNWLAPAVFGARTITFWQALGLLILCKILFGGFRGGPGGHRRWERMTPEEREKFRAGIRSRCGWSSATPAVPESQEHPI